MKVNISSNHAIDHAPAPQVFDQCMTTEAKPSSDGGTALAGARHEKGNVVRMDYEFIEDAFHYVVTEDPNDKESKHI